MKEENFEGEKYKVKKKAYLLRMDKGTRRGKKVSL